MESFSSKSEHRSVELTCVADIVQFSTIVHNSASHLDLRLSEYCAIKDNGETLSYGSMLSSTNDIISSQEKCRKILTPSRDLLYTLHLDFPKNREYSLMEKKKHGSFSRYYRVPHISEIYYRSDIFVRILSAFVHYAVNYTDQRIKVFNWLLKFEIVKESHFHLLHHSIVNDFLNCLYLNNIHYTMLKDFFKKFVFNYWMYKCENPAILEYFLYNACRGGRSFEKDRPRNYDLTDVCISKGYFLNIAPILKCIDSPRLSGPYGAYLFQPQYARSDLSEEVLTLAGSWMTKERKRLILQLLLIYLKASTGSCVTSASEALRLLWNSLPVPFISLQEISMIFGDLLCTKEIWDIYLFYAQTIGEFHESLNPRTLKHLCRASVRKALGRQKWLPDGINELCLPIELKLFLNLDMGY